MMEADSKVYSFSAEGMNTLFSLRLRHEDRKVAEGFAGNGFRLLEELEADLSRYRPDSDVSRINNLATGESMLLNAPTYKCLRIALQATEHTAGLFDPSVGADTAIGHQRSMAGRAEGGFALSSERPEITCQLAGRKIDLGGVGKGFALDEMAAVLLDLGVDSALLSSGASTHLALGSKSWTLHLRGDLDGLELELSNEALSSSGLGEQGAHVVHPDTGGAPDYVFKRVWVVAESAALADAYSTACLLMNEAEVASFAEVRRRQVRIFTEQASGSDIVHW
jgi:thiamine biosynthesis lipoprotein